MLSPATMASYAAAGGASVACTFWDLGSRLAMAPPIQQFTQGGAIVIWSQPTTSTLFNCCSGPYLCRDDLTFGQMHESGCSGGWLCSGRGSGPLPPACRQLNG